MSQSPWSHVLPTTTIVVAAIVGLLVFSAFVMTALPVSESRLQQVEVGATPAEVVSLLGEPARKLEDANRWQYARPYLWMMVDVQFEDGKVVHVGVDR